METKIQVRVFWAVIPSSDVVGYLILSGWLERLTRFQCQAGILSTCLA